MKAPPFLMSVVLVGVTLVGVVHVSRFITMVFVGVALVRIVFMVLGVVFVGVALVGVVHVSRFVTVVFVGVALVPAVISHQIAPFEKVASKKVPDLCRNSFGDTGHQPDQNLRHHSTDAGI